MSTPNLTNPFLPAELADPTPSDVFGPIIGADDVRAAVLATIKMWSGTYLAEIARTEGLNGLVDFRSWVIVGTFGELQDTQTPAVMVSSRGTSGTPARRGNGQVEARWLIDCSVVVNGQNWEDTAARVGWYCKAVRTLLVQKPGLGGLATDTQWLGEAYGKVPAKDSRTMGAGMVSLLVVVQSALDRFHGPSVPSTAPAPPWAIATDVGLVVNNLPVTDALP